jgi:hypothetical protein
MAFHVNDNIADVRCVVDGRAYRHPRGYRARAHQKVDIHERMTGQRPPGSFIDRHSDSTARRKGEKRSAT